MPAAPAAPPPAAPAAAPPRSDAAGILPPPQVSASSIAPPVEPPAPKPGSRKEEMFKTLREKYSKPAPGTEEPPAKPADQTSPKPQDQTPPKPADEPPKPADQTPPKPGDPTEPDRKIEKPTKDFWRAFDAWKDRAIKAETALSTAEGLTMSPDTKKQLEERVEKAEARAKQYEDHIRLVDYSQHPEFQDKYVKPYEQAWDRAMAEVSELTIKDGENGEPRQAGVRDLAAIVDAGLMEARAMAEAMFGPFAGDIMAFRKEIRDLNAAQTNALKKAKEEGTSRIQQATEQTQKQLKALAGEISTQWNKFTEEGTKHPTLGKYLKPVEGDKEINDRLAKGRALVERAFNENPKDPKLSPEERAAVIKRHAAVFNRAIGFGRMALELERALSKMAEMQKKLDGYTASTPTTVGQPSSPAAAPAKNGWTSIREGLQKIAKPA